jgi:hypothetical protein
MPLTIIKASGRSEEFDIQKLVNSLIRSGATNDVAQDIAEKVKAKIGPAAHTRHIFKIAKRMLRKYNHVSDMRYSIKKSIYALGPAGYQFEKYVAKILKFNGYSVEVDRIIRGYCVAHEVDIFANKENRGFVIECKYHSNGGNPTDVKTALYVYSRFTDIKKAYDLMPENKFSVQQGWLVTNTRCTADAITYAECVGLKIVSWKYPEKDSLENMIERNGLYPVTILPAVKTNVLDVLFRNDIILAKDIADMDEKTFIRVSGLDAEIAKTLKREADELCCVRG